MRFFYSVKRNIIKGMTSNEKKIIISQKLRVK